MNQDKMDKAVAREKQQDIERFKAIYLHKVQTMHGKSITSATKHDKYTALSSVIRDYISGNWIQTNRQYTERGEKQVYYFSMEFLLGKLMDMNLINIGLRSIAEAALKDLDIELEELEAEESDAGLGNGGLGRLAACFMDSMAALQLPGHGCGIRYKYGLFEQKIVNHYQCELPDNWLKDGYIWEFRRADKAVTVRFGGNVYMEPRPDGPGLRCVHEHYEPILAVPYDIPMIGYHNNTVNTLRLWNAEPIQSEFDISSFNRGDYMKAVEYQQSVERISKILYPEDTFHEGRVLRLKQQYFFVSAGLQSILRRYGLMKRDIRDLPSKVAVHINDTHPAVAIPELMRILMDDFGLGWDAAWSLTTRTISYTNHTIMPEALEKWPVEMIRELMPRVYMIIEEINRRFCETIMVRYPGDEEALREMAIIADGQVHMARLAVVGSYSVNGVAAIHTDILKNHVMSRFNQQFPGRFNNKTNGIAHRRWIVKANPELTELISQTIGSGWIRQPAELTALLKHTQDAAFQEKVAAVKLRNKERLAKFIFDKQGIVLDPRSIFDVQIKRIHAYKRQILNALHIMDLYNQLKENPALEMVPRTFIFGGKAAPSYNTAKQTIKLINDLAEVINNDPRVQDKIKVVFLENYSVSLGEILFPAADVSEQISTASKEASGTGNMKFMLNGAVTIGTMDGANVEIAQAVGAENIIIFGLTSEEVLRYYREGGYVSWDMYHNNQRIRAVLDQLASGVYAPDREPMTLLHDSLLRNNDEFFVLGDFEAYAAGQQEVARRYLDLKRWRSMSITNIAHAGIFASDRTIMEYANDIWKVRPVDAENSGR